MDSSLLLGGWRLSAGTSRLGEYHQGQLCQVKDISREGCINMVNEEVQAMCYSTGCCDYLQNFIVSSLPGCFEPLKWGLLKINVCQGWQALKQCQH